MTYTHRCNVCSCEYTDDEGGVEGNFGILPVSFCPTCFSCMCDMASQYIDPVEKESDPEYDELLRHLKGIRRIAINFKHGGFGLSYEAKIRYLELNQIPYTLVEQQDRHTQLTKGPLIQVNGQYFWDHDIDRDDPVLITVINEMAEKANGECANLKIVEIPADVKWQIEDYDGAEWVSEVHRTWR